MKASHSIGSDEFDMCIVGSRFLIILCLYPSFGTSSLGCFTSAVAHNMHRVSARDGSFNN
jgi:hypothetical protein